jgi:cytochrome P450
LYFRDPVAIKHILSNPNVFAKSPDHRFLLLVAFGPGSVFYVEGDAHRRIRAVMNPMFSASSVRALIPVLEKIAQNVSTYRENRKHLTFSLSILFIAF